MNVIQCPVCNEMNKVPKVMDRIDELLMLAKANTCTTYADINHTVPLVNYIVVCPYCKCDNKVRETACFQSKEILKGIIINMTQKLEEYYLLIDQ